MKYFTHSNKCKLIYYVSFLNSISPCISWKQHSLFSNCITISSQSICFLQWNTHYSHCIGISSQSIYFLQNNTHYYHCISISSKSIYFMQNNTHYFHCISPFTMVLLQVSNTLFIRWYFNSISFCEFSDLYASIKLAL